jgi:poly(3-hydroxybutyrate) depolymerase
MRTFGASSSSANADPSRRAADYRAGVLSTRFPSAVHSGSDIALPAPGLRALPSPPSQPLEPPARECLLYIPSELPVDRPVPFLVMLHGAGGDPEPMVTLVQPQADRHGVVVLAPPSLGRSWDTISGRSYGPDVKVSPFGP